ncbi:unnamed protein product [Caenorhabditis angaria]|uniref:Uncharacterized protein n=1 Tax=Caenorhabditis angaria TaxID=860376 RepID=A0A9P1IMD8_9PELO|nr:unnamed protein product [Caenorhabditis angaria]
MELSEIQSISTKSPEETRDFFAKWNAKSQKVSEFSDIDYFTRQEFAKIVAKFKNSPEISAILIETIRLISRDKTGIETMMSDELCDTVLSYANLVGKRKDQDVENVKSEFFGGGK